jgi:hypothetical protein
MRAIGEALGLGCHVPNSRGVGVGLPGASLPTTHASQNSANQCRGDMRVEGHGH